MQLEDDPTMVAVVKLLDERILDLTNQRVELQRARDMVEGTAAAEAVERGYREATELRAEFLRIREAVAGPLRTSRPPKVEPITAEQALREARKRDAASKPNPTRKKTAK